MSEDIIIGVILTITSITMIYSLIMCCINKLFSTKIKNDFKIIQKASNIQDNEEI